MSIVLEDGSGVAGANSYASVAQADSYHQARGRTDWSGTAEEKAAALIRGTDRLERRFGHRFKGARAGAQALSWPRAGVRLADGTALPADAVPDRLVSACCEYARIALGRAELDPIPAETDVAQTGRVTNETTSEQVGSLSVSTTKGFESIADRVRMAQYQGDRKPTSLAVGESGLMEYPAADLWLDGLLLPLDTREQGSAPNAAISGTCRKEFGGDDWSDSFVNDGGTYPAAGQYES